MEFLLTQNIPTAKRKLTLAKPQKREWSPCVRRERKIIIRRKFVPAAGLHSTARLLYAGIIRLHFRWYCQSNYSTSIAEENDPAWQNQPSLCLSHSPQRGSALQSLSHVCWGFFSSTCNQQMSGCQLESKQIPTKSAEVGQRELMHEYDREASLL